MIFKPGVDCDFNNTGRYYLARDTFIYNHSRCHFNIFKKEYMWNKLFKTGMTLRN